MRIAIFSESYAPVVNGVSVSINTLRREMKLRGHKVFVFAPRYPGYSDPVDGVYRFPSRVTGAAPDYPLPIPYSPKLRRRFLELDIDIVHTQTPFLLGMIGIKWARAAGIPVVTTNHTLYPEYAHYVKFMPNRITRAATVWHMKRYYSSCKAVVAPSTPVMKILRGYGIETPIEVIQTGIDILPQRRSREETRAAYGIPADVPLLVYVGRVALEKNLGMLLDAFSEVKQRVPDVRLMIVGGGPILDRFKGDVESLGLAGSVILTGMLAQPDVWDINRAADLFVFPSVTETQGLAVCEALSAGLPCVVVNAGGAPEVLDDGVDGYLAPNDKNAFASAICGLLSDHDKRSRMSLSALELSKRFSSAGMAERFARFYLEHLERD
jgi:1,2-diacylglycerol 3-alpha-glucosyltransferase